MRRSGASGAAEVGVGAPADACSDETGIVAYAAYGDTEDISVDGWGEWCEYVC